jgi:GTP-binding protein
VYDRPVRQPVFAIVGRPNVGKSTLFNRIAGRPISIVEDVPGVTRDRIYAHADLFVDGDDARVTIIDTGGFEPEPSSELFAAVREQTQLAIEEADVIIHVVDARAGVSPDDVEVARLLRRSGRPLVIAANKLDSPKQAGLEGAFWELGVDQVMPIAAAHGRGTSDLLEAAWNKLPPELQEGARAAARERFPPEPDEDELERALAEAELQSDEAIAEPQDAAQGGETVVAVPEVLRIAVVGRPNAGKSSLINKLLGEDRHLVSDVPGTTVDSVDSFLEFGSKRYRLIDTAGIRRKRSIAANVEKYAVVSALKGMDRADVAFFVIDAKAGVAEQDLKIASFAEEKGLAVVLVVNKWDLARAEGTKDADKLDAETYARQIREAMPFLAHAPIRFVSAKTGKRVLDLLDTAAELARKHFARVPTGELNRAIKAAVDGHQPPMHKGRRTKLYFGTQVRVAPPTFVIAVNDPEGVHFSYRRYLNNRFREHFDFGGAPIRLFFRRRKQTADRPHPASKKGAAPGAGKGKRGPRKGRRR